MEANTVAFLAQQRARERGLGLLHYRNLRDLGGLPTRDGRVVAGGRLFRGSSPSRFEPREHEALAALGLVSVIDLRTTDEVTASSIALQLPALRVFHHPLFEAARLSWIAPSDQAPRSTATRYLEMLSDGLENLADIVLRAAEPDAAPLLVCCTAGRDRTGIVTACLLDLLDVSDALIAADYARSDTLVHDGSRAHVGTVVEFLQLLRERHGSTRRMLGACGVSDRVVTALRQSLLV